MGGERAPRDAWQALLGGVTREELAALSDADWDLIEKRAVGGVRGRRPDRGRDRGA